VTKQCISCGMPLRTADDFAAKDSTKTYCNHCATATGELKSYEETLRGMTTFLVETQGLDENVARETAKRTMAKLPAWSSRT
jgi:hypothetical protein